MEKTILHADGNCFYASVEMKMNPALREVPLAVGGDEDARHGIVLAKNDIAKKYKVQTGEALVVARQKCPDLRVVPARYNLYLEHAAQMRDLFLQYTDQVEAFGLDECWLDVTNSLHLFGSGREIADEIRRRVWDELRLTLSVGVSFNKIFAKIGSDIKKPDATTVITRGDFRQTVWPLPVQDLMYVGASTKERLRRSHIRTIGQLARTDPGVLHGLLGKWGYVLWVFANGEDPAAVAGFDAQPVIKSVGNSSTTPHDLRTERDIKITLYLMAESVAARLREYGYKSRTAQICVRGNDMTWYQRQAPLPYPCQDSEELFKAAWALYRQNRSRTPVRTLGVRASNLIDDKVTQMSMLPDLARVHRHENLERAIDAIRKRYGNFSVRRAVMLTDMKLAAVNPLEDHVIHPVSYFR
ncbi:MAG: DNA polymerase IV [Defluviitaleaceae bacterium]|nr:DNA polymerase IV [Defluviitaleaceae bacterium]